MCTCFCVYTNTHLRLQLAGAGLGQIVPLEDVGKLSADEITRQLEQIRKAEALQVSVTQVGGLRLRF